VGDTGNDEERRALEAEYDAAAAADAQAAAGLAERAAKERAKVRGPACVMRFQGLGYEKMSFETRAFGHVRSAKAVAVPGKCARIAMQSVDVAQLHAAPRQQGILSPGCEHRCYLRREPGCCSQHFFRIPHLGMTGYSGAACARAGRGSGAAAGGVGASVGAAHPAAAVPGGFASAAASRGVHSFVAYLQVWVGAHFCVGAADSNLCIFLLPGSRMSSPPLIL